METVTVSAKYQVVIPRAIRQSLGIQPGQKIQVFLYNNRVEFVPVKRMRQMRGAGYPLHSACPNMLCGLTEGFGSFDHRVISRGRRTHSLLQESKKQLASAFRLAPIEAKREFIQVVGQVFMCHCALVGTQ